MSTALTLRKLVRSFRQSWSTVAWYRFDWVAPLCLLVLCGTGVLFIYSSQVYTGGNLWLRQLLWVFTGLGLYGVVSMLHYRWFFEHAHLLFIGAIVLLVLVLSPLGTKVYGAQRWIDLRVMSLQPSELAKVTTLLVTARILSRFHFQSVVDSVSSFLIVATVTALPTLLIFLQPDLGSALVIPIMTFFILYSAGFHKRFFQVALTLLVLVVGVIGIDLYRYDAHLQRQSTEGNDATAYQNQSWLPIKDYQRNRLMAFVAPERIDPQGLGASWNVRQSLISIGTGGWTGKGWTEGTQARLGYLPQTVAYNDFIFSVIAEESGFIGSSAVILIFAILVFNGIRIAQLTHDRFGQILATGVSVFLFIHLFINIGMTLGITPVTGLPLPFLSYGGTFLLSCFIMLGFQQSIYRYREKRT